MHTKPFFLRRSFAGRPMERPLHTTRILAGVLLIIITASISSPAVASPTQDLPTKTDGEALLLFKKSIGKDPNGVLKGWKPSTDHCRWSGVSCSSGRVSKLDLPRAGLSAGDSRADSIAALSALDMLTFLDLSDNELLINASSLLRLSPALKQLDLAGAGVSGAVPGGLLSKFPGVAYVDLSHNNLSGLLPDDVLLGADELQILDLSYNNLSGDVSGLYTANSCKSLLHFDVSVNSFVGSIPSSLSNCQRLKNLNLAYNDFAGAIPSSFTSFNGLQQLDLSNNHLSGDIPADIGDSCGSLVQLRLSDNNISGGIPLSFSSCSSLVVLDLANNNISGDFPDSILSRLSSLQKLLVSNNFISGPLPLSLSQSKTLKIADFSSNKLSGRLPAGICPGASSLEELRAPDNLISGEIPGELTLCSQLKTIDLSINNLTGAIPPELGRLANLENLMVWFNGLTGGIPPELGRSSKLRNLILNNNFLTGAIPTELFQCRNLEWISLTSNRLAGEISPAFGTLSRLAILQLANNSLTGDIPAELGNCSSLVWLDLNSNRLTGRIPARLGRQPGDKTPTGILSGNTIAFVRNVGCKSVGGLLEFAGIKPERLLQVPALKPCDFTRLYSGAALTDWSHFESLEYLDLSYNGLEGGIPPEFGDMTVLQVLDLAHNRLTGEIPGTIGKLSNLGVFDASHNRLRGTIPDSFSNLSFLVQIDFSDNSLTGPIPSRGQLSTLPASQFANNPGLCGVPLPPCGTTPSPSSTATATTASTSRRQVAWANSTIVLGVMATLAVLCIVAVWGIAVRARRREKRAARMLGSLAAGGRAATTWKLGREREPLSINVATFQRQLRKLTFSALIEATNGFSADSLVGSGGFGEVFRATLKDGSSVAVKKLVRLSCQGDREFTAEMETLGKIKHRNLVPLLGYCKVGEERLLVYEFMHFGSLEEMLHGQNKTKALTWDERKKIARGAAKGLCFLHHNCIPHIIHRDMKSSNVLLDKDMEARVSDFGMARLISALDTHLSVSTLAGTPGYVPPEYYQSFRCTAKGDVYSFGVVVLELLTGRRPTEKEEFGDTNLVGWVKGMVREGREREVLDGEMVATAAGREVEEMGRCLEIAVQCVDDFPSRRPNMLQVVAMLRELVSFPGDGAGDGGGDGVGGD